MGVELLVFRYLVSYDFEHLFELVVFFFIRVINYLHIFEIHKVKESWELEYKQSLIL